SGSAGCWTATASVPRPSSRSGAGMWSMASGSLLAEARVRMAPSSSSTGSPSGPETHSGPGEVPGPGKRRTAVTSGLAAGLGLERGQLVDLGLEGGEARLEGRHIGGVIAVVIVNDVLGGVADVGLEILGPVEQVVHEVLRVVDDVLEEAGEGVLAAGHGDQALAPASWSSASWLTLAVRSARAACRPARSLLEAETFSSSSTASVTASFTSVSRSLARSRMSSTKSLVSSTMSSMNRVR